MFTLTYPGGKPINVTKYRNFCLFWDRASESWSFSWEDDNVGYTASYLLVQGKLDRDSNGDFISFPLSAGTHVRLSRDPECAQL